jgi:hypothetical protein
MPAAGLANPAFWVAVVAIAGAIAAIYRRARTIEADYKTVPHWPQLLGFENGAAPDAATRIELVGRLAIVAEPWCVDTLREAAKEERHPHVRKAIDAAWKTLR